MHLPDGTSAIQSISIPKMWPEWGFWWFWQGQGRLVNLVTWFIARVWQEWHLAWSWENPLERWCWLTRKPWQLYSWSCKGSCSLFCFWSVLEKRLVRNFKSSVRLQQWNLWPWLAWSTFVMDMFEKHRDSVSNQVYNIAYIRLKLVETTK